MAGYGLTEKRLQPARLRNLYGGLQLRETTAAYGGLRRRLRGLFETTNEQGPFLGTESRSYSFLV